MAIVRCVARISRSLHEESHNLLIAPMRLVLDLNMEKRGVIISQHTKGSSHHEQSEEKGDDNETGPDAFSSSGHYAGERFGPGGQNAHCAPKTGKTATGRIFSRRSMVKDKRPLPPYHAGPVGN